MTDTNLWQVAVAFTARLVIKKTWQNDRDQLLAPPSKLSEEFKADCLIWMLFHGNNLSAGANGLHWNERNWNLVNHFIPYTEEEVGSDGRFESNFMSQYLLGCKITTKAREVLDACRPIWAEFYADRDPRSVREQLFLNRPDVGWYQVRNALRLRNTVDPSVVAAFNKAYAELGDKLRPQIYSYGMLLM